MSNSKKISAGQIEFEIRSEVLLEDFNRIKAVLESLYGPAKKTKRLSVLFLGQGLDGKIDLRIRIDSTSKAEVVIKKGDYHERDRVEYAVSVEKKEFIGLVKVFSSLGYESKITERENQFFDAGNGVGATLVTSGNICYVEIEKMTTEKNLGADEKVVRSVMGSLGLKEMTKDGFTDICKRLSSESDISFNATEAEYRILQDKLNQY